MKDKLPILYDKETGDLEFAFGFGLSSTNLGEYEPWFVLHLPAPSSSDSMNSTCPNWVSVCICAS